jgi:hypothetical protein
MLFFSRVRRRSRRASPFVHDTMTGDDDRDSIRSVRVSDGPLSRSGSDTVGEFLVRTSHTVRNAEQFIPHAYLKR